MTMRNPNWARGVTAGMGLLVAVAVSGCSAGTAEEPDADEVGDVPITLRNGPPPEAAGTDDPGAVPGVPDDVVDKAGCAYVKWCDEPGPWGTVCQKTGCTLAAAIEECIVDARYVCGTIIQPFAIDL